MRRIVFLMALLFLLAAPATSFADTGQIGPSFACPRPAPADGLSQLICESPAMSREEVVFEQAYYALRHFYGRADWKALKAQAVTFNTALRTRCGIPLAGASDQTVPAGATACYIDQTEKDRNSWLQQLTGPALEEASRPIEQHISLQQHLLDLGYLPSGTKADGIYGEATRDAIVAWQRAAGRPQATGFLSNDDASVLSTSTARAAPLAAVVGASGVEAGLRTNGRVTACSNPRATRALGNKTDPRQGDPRWVAFVKSDGGCFSVSPDQQWERISEKDGLLLLRRLPPVAGEPPLFFLPSDIEIAAPPAPNLPAPAESVTAASPEAVPAVTTPDIISPPDGVAQGQPQEPVQEAAPAAQPVQPVEETPTASVASSGSGGAGVIVLFILIAVIAGIAARIYLVQKAAKRRIDRATALSVTEITAQQRPLRVRRQQLESVDVYGTTDLSKWVKEKETFIQSRIAPLLAAEGLGQEWPAIARYVDLRIEMAAATPIVADQQAQFFSNPELFDPRMTPTDYELHCALLLRSAGWDAQTTIASGDQGTDVFAKRAGKTLVLQCKLYSQPVGNSAVQEISAARLHQQADYAAVVSNAAFTPAARQLARTNNVYLLHHEELRAFDPTLRAASVNV